MRLIRSYGQKCIKHVSCVRTSGSRIDGPKEELCRCVCFLRVDVGLGELDICLEMCWTCILLVPIWDC